MKRSDFESQVAGRLGAVLDPYGFRLTPQPPAHLHDATPRAIFETDPVDFQRRLPGLAAQMGSLHAVSCIDLTITWAESTGALDVDLEGFDLVDLLSMTGGSGPPSIVGRSLDEQLDSAAALLRGCLQHLSRHP